MRSHRSYELASGSVTGRDHRLVPKNSQDGVYVARSDVCTVAIVTDGCGSGKHTEVGAKLGARLLCASLQNELSTVNEAAAIRWSRVRQDVLAKLHLLASSMGGSFNQTVQDYLLFSIVGVLLTETDAVFFAIGDGMVVINGEVTILHPLDGNRPPYLAYGLVDSDIEQEYPGATQFQVIHQGPNSELDHFLLGCDGLHDLVRHAEDPLPGLAKPVGPLNQFWKEDKFFANPDMVSRHLRLVARDWPRQSPQPGLLSDDTTLVVGRHCPVQDPPPNP